MTKSLLSRSRNTLVALSLVVSALSTGCAVGVADQDEQLLTDEEAMVEDEALLEKQDRDAIVQQLAEDAEAGELSDREAVLVELLGRVEAGEGMDVSELRIIVSADGPAEPDAEVLDPVVPELPEGPVTY
jgi:hypothetical protein